MDIVELAGSKTPELRSFRQILMWPLLLKDPGRRSTGKELLARWVKGLESAQDGFCGKGSRKIWHEVKQGGASDPDWRVAPYEEVVYFHPFVRDFLYGDAKTQPPVRHFQRVDVKEIRVELGYRDSARSEKEIVDTYSLGITKVSFYGFDTGIVLFVIEVEKPVAIDANNKPSDRILRLAEIETILDQLRRAYPPYWNGPAGSSVAARFPRTVTLACEGGGEIGPFKPEETDLRGFVKKGAEPPMAEHWRKLLFPLVPFEGGSEADHQRLSVQQVEDERIPSMCYLAFDDPRSLTKGDMARIALLDDAGSPETLPYAQNFLSNFDKEYCYDAFWGPKVPESPRWEATMAGQPAADMPWWTTRFMCCGYGFTVLGPDDPDFFMNKKNGIHFQFGHHYFKMGLIAHFHRASLLMFSERLSDAVKVLDSNSDVSVADRYTKLRDEVRAIQDDLLRFRSRYWFTEVSNHLQPRILFDLWSRHLNTRELFAQVLDEASTINEVLGVREQEKQTTESVRLSVIATFGLGASIFVNGLALYAVHSEDGFASFFLVVALIVYVSAFVIIAFSGQLGVAIKGLAECGSKYLKERRSRENATGGTLTQTEGRASGDR